MKYIDAQEESRRDQFFSRESPNPSKLGGEMEMHPMTVRYHNGPKCEQ